MSSVRELNNTGALVLEALLSVMILSVSIALIIHASCLKPLRVTAASNGPKVACGFRWDIRGNTARLRAVQTDEECDFLTLARAEIQMTFSQDLPGWFPCRR